MSDEKQESMADIVAEMRDHVVSARAWKAGIKPGVVMDFADRLEAAWKRERDEMLGALVRIGNWCAQDLCENAYGGDTSGNYLKTLNGLCEICRPFMRKATDNTIGGYCE